MKRKKSDAFGPVLRQLRDAKNLSQEQLAERVDVSGSFISALESCQKYPNLEMMFHIAEALEVKPSALIAAMEERLGIS